MAFPKNHLFATEDQRIGKLGRALGHPARSCILRILEREGPLLVHEIVALLPLCEGSVTEHLRKLRLAGLVQVKERGLRNEYRLDHEGILRLHEEHTAFVRSLVETGAAVKVTSQRRENP